MHQDEFQLQQTVVHIQAKTAEVVKEEGFKKWWQKESLETATTPLQWLCLC